MFEQWIERKYRERKEEKKKGLIKTANIDDLVFGSRYSINRKASLYVKLIHEFQKLLAITGWLKERKAEYTKEERSPSIR
jgi:hypothetical protein